MRRALALVPVAVLAALPSVATAGELIGTDGAYTYTDTAGSQTNDVVVTRSGNDVVFTDSAGITENSTECSQAIPTAATCTFVSTDRRSVSMVLAGGNDKADTSGAAETASNLDGGAGEDELTGSDEGSTLTGGPDNDTLTGGPTGDRLDGGEGDDDLFALGGADDLDGQAGADDLQGGDGTDRLLGGAGPDALSGGAEDAFEPCGDTLNYEASTNDLTIVLDAQANDDTGDGDTIAADIESVDAGSGNDSITGNDRPNCFDGAGGNDTLAGLREADFLGGESGADTVDGGDGDDSLSGDAIDGVDGGDVYIGGDGVDQVTFSTSLCDTGLSTCTARDLTITIDAQANDGAAGEGDDVRLDVEDVSAFGFGAFFGFPTGTVNATGSAQFNIINTAEAADTVDPAGGSDSIRTGEGSDTVNARDGFADRADCGDGGDTANVDQLDTVKDCETVNRETVVLESDDRPPSVVLGAPAPGATLDPGGPTTLRADAADDRGVQRVVFMDDDRVLCTDDAAPYECGFQPRGADVGPALLTAVALDTLEQGAFVSVPVTIAKFRARRLTIAFRRGRASGTLRLPPALAPADGCKGFVRVTARIGRRTITRRVRLAADCRYRVRIRVRRGRRVTFRARFGGSAALAARNAAPLTIG